MSLKELDFNNAGAWPKEWQIGFCVLLGLLILIVLWNFMTSSKGDTLEALEMQEKTKRGEFEIEAQKAVSVAIKSALKEKSDSPEDMERRLKEKGIECKYKVEEGKLKYSSYSYQGTPIKGQDVGFTAKQLQARLDKNQEIKKEQAQQIKPEQENKPKRGKSMGF